MKTLIIDAANEKIFFSIIEKTQSYTTSYPNSRENFDKFLILLNKFLSKKQTNIDEINQIFINQGPGKFSSLRIAIAIAKGISLSRQIKLFGFRSMDVSKNDYKKVLKLDKKKLSINNLIKPYYSS